MFRRFAAWWLGSWSVLTGFISLAIWLAVGSLNTLVLLVVAVLAALLATMIAAGQCGGPPSSYDRHGLKRW